VLIEHRSVFNILLALDEKYPFSETDAYLLKTSFIFDVSVTELFGWFFGGGRLVVLEKGGEKDPQMILDAIECTGITHINFVPSMFHVLLEVLDPGNITKLSHLRYIFLAGEALLPGLVEKFNRLKTGIVLENIYGPTEATIYASQYPLSEWTGGIIPIGKPLQNIQLYILNKYDRMQPIGVVGELCIAGVGLAWGYLNRPELTAEKFVISHQSLVNDNSTNDRCLMTNDGSYRLYHTGDLARWLTDGSIEFLGRIDHQVKIRGFRIELGEIECRLQDIQGIKEACVIDRKKLGKRLPGYMVPSHFISIEQIPLTPSGKTDRKELLALEFNPTTDYIAPKSRTEKIVADTWKEVLQLDKVGVNDNFFDIGGHSLNIIKVKNKLKRLFDKDITAAEMFLYPTIRTLADYFSRENADVLAPRIDERIDETEYIMKEATDILFADEID
jgi:polyketide synthase PksN